MNRTCVKQSGFTGVVPLLIMALLVTSTLVATLVTVQETRNFDLQVESMDGKIKSIIEAAWAYHLGNINNVADPTLETRWAADIETLYNASYLQRCDPTATCIDIDKTPWGSDITMTPFTPVDNTNPSSPVNRPAKLRIAFDTAGAAGGNVAEDIALANILAARYPAAGVTGTVVSFEVGRPGVEIAHDALTRRDGTAPPTADWNFDNYSITGLKDINFEGFVGGDGQPVSLRESVFDTISLVSHGQYVNKPTCPTGLTPKIYLASAQMVGKGAKAVKIGGFQNNATHSGNQWLVTIRYYTQNSAGNGYWEYPNASDAKALAFTRCEV